MTFGAVRTEGAERGVFGKDLAKKLQVLDFPHDIPLVRCGW